MFKVETKDALLHAINEEYVEAVEVLLDHEESIHKEGEPWVCRISSSLTSKLIIKIREYSLKCFFSKILETLSDITGCAPNWPF